MYTKGRNKRINATIINFYFFHHYPTQVMSSHPMARKLGGCQANFMEHMWVLFLLILFCYESILDVWIKVLLFTFRSVRLSG